jgi:hypothetical protein
MWKELFNNVHGRIMKEHTYSCIEQFFKPVSFKNCEVVTYGAGVDEDRYPPFKFEQSQGLILSSDEKR